MIPPRTIDVTDRHTGFIAWIESPKNGSYTLWRPGRVLKKSTEGTLVKYAENSFWQTNNNVTVATYRVPGYRYPVMLWFDNETGKRLG